MKNTTIITYGGILFLIIILMFLGARVLNDRDPVDDDIMMDENGEVQDEVDGRYANIERVEAKHFYVDGVHTFAGEIPMPTPCDLLETDVEVREAFPEQIHINFTVINEADFCAQVITPQRFMVSAPASDEATVTASFMGRDIELNLIDPEPGETPEDFELFIKG